MAASGSLDDGDLNANPSGTLRGVHGSIGLGDQMLTPDTKRIARGDPDAAGQIDRRPESFHTNVRDPIADAFRDRVRRRDVGAAEDDDKLLAAIAPDDIRL